MNILITGEKKIHVKHRKAFSLIEILLTFTIFAAIISSALSIYSVTRENSKLNQTVISVIQIRSLIESLYHSQAVYTGVAASALQTSLSTYAYTGGEISNPYFGVFAINSDTIYFLDDSYDIIVTNLEPYTCANLAVSKFGDSLYAINIDPQNGKSPVSGAITNLPLKPAAAVLACSGAHNSIGFQFH